MYRPRAVPRDRHEPPRVTVVAATRDRPVRLRMLLDGLRVQTVGPGTFDVVIADDGSGPETAAVLDEAVAAGDLRLRVIRRSRPGGPAVARNAGWRAATAPLVAFTDDDCVPDPGWLEAGLRAAAARPGAVLQGRVDPMPSERHLLGPFSRTLSVPVATPTVPTANIFYPREVLERIGGFDEGFGGVGGEDTDLAWRAMRAGAATAFVEDATVFHAVTRLGPLGKLRVAARWGPTMRTFKLHPELRRLQMTHRVFWKGSHYLLARALLALVIPRRRRVVRRWLAMPYALHLLERGRVEGGGPALAPYYLVHDLVELVTVLRAAVRYRTWVL